MKRETDGALTNVRDVSSVCKRDIVSYRPNTLSRRPTKDENR
jgi:hypothetical protein